MQKAGVHKLLPVMGGQKFRAGAVLFAFLLAVAVGAVVKLEWVLTPKHAYILLPAVTVTKGEVAAAEWSPDGAYLMVAALEPSFSVVDALNAGGSGSAATGRSTILVWDRRSRQVRRLWSSDDPTLKVRGIFWLHGSSCAYVDVWSTVKSRNGVRDSFGLISMDAATGNYLWVPGMERLQQEAAVSCSPLKPLAVAVFGDEPYRPNVDSNSDIAANYWTIAPNAQVVKRCRGQDAWRYSLAWAADGANWYVQAPKPRSKGLSTLAIGNDGSATPVNVALYKDVEQPNPELWLHDKTTVATQRRVKRNLNNVWLSSPIDTYHPDVLVTADGNRAMLSPSADAVFYVEGGVARVRPIDQLSDDQKRALFDIVKAETMSNAKQCALGLMMYSNDYDDLLPPGGGFSQVDPYIKSDDIMADFIYTPPSQLNMTMIANPSTMPIGYINGPGGQAVAYADGHVGWIPTP
ncbi:MAG: hypothetical protein ACYC96_08400 [Fimbriimonadaceae bacterium]